MKKYLVALTILLALCLLPSFVSAAGDGLELKESKEITVKDEKVILETWVDLNGDEFHVIANEVEDINEIAEYIDKLLSTEQNINHDYGVITPQAEFDRTPWYRTLNNTDSLGYVYWSTSGYSEYAYLRPITANKMHVNDGSITIRYTGTGVADKIISSYSYNFSGITLSITYPPTLSKTSQTVSYKSSSITGVNYVNHKTHWAEATSRTSFPSVSLTASPDVYKGSYIYRPRVTSNVSF